MRKALGLLMGGEGNAVVGGGSLPFRGPPALCVKGGVCVSVLGGQGGLGLLCLCDIFGICFLFVGPFFFFFFIFF